MIDYQQVLDDLYTRKRDLEAAIACVERIAGTAPKARRQYKRQQKPEAETDDQRVEVKPMGLRDAIRQAVSEPPLRTATEVADRVCELIPGQNRNTISSEIWVLIKNKELFKDGDLKLRPVPVKEKKTA